jgi:hypothetical protein
MVESAQARMDFDAATRRYKNEMKPGWLYMDEKRADL